MKVVLFFLISNVHIFCKGDIWVPIADGQSLNFPTSSMRGTCTYYCHRIEESEVGLHLTHYPVPWVSSNILILNSTSDQPVLRTECLRGRPFPPPSTEVITFYFKIAGSTVNSVDHWLPHCWTPTLSLLTVDHQSPHCWLSTLSLLTVDHRSPHCWPSTLSLLTVDHQSPHCWLLTLSLRLTVDCWPSHCWLLIPPRINSQQCWSSITSLLTIDPLTVDCWSSITSLLTVDPLTVDCWLLIASLLSIDLSLLTVDC